MTVRFPLFARAVLLAALSLVLAGATPAYATDSGEPALLITYHAAPANRLALQHELSGPTAQAFAHLKATGLLKSAGIFLNRYTDNGTWDAAALLTFTSDAALAQWQKIEASTPAGLSPEDLALTSSIDTTPIDLIRHGSAPHESATPVYLLIPYEYLVSVGDYVKYLDGYTVPQIEGWIGENVLSTYAIYLAHYPAGRPWTAMLVLAYRDEAGLAKRDEVVAKVRARLANNPAWKAISDDKKNIRVERELVVADPVASNESAGPTPK